MTALSILDLSPVTAGSTGSQALRNTLDLARLADRLGFTRYWVAEHHNMASIASSAPDIMIGQIAAATSKMRVGSGGVMLPNHAPLMVAERFKVLEALFPGRIDLGLGRAPGTDQATSYALRRRQGISEEDDFLDRFNELMLMEARGFPADEAMRLYRESFKPSPSHDKPYAILGTHVVCADTDEEANRLAATVDLTIALRANCLLYTSPSPRDRQKSRMPSS